MFEHPLFFELHNFSWRFRAHSSGVPSAFIGQAANWLTKCLWPQLWSNVSNHTKTGRNVKSLISINVKDRDVFEILPILLVRCWCFRSLDDLFLSESGLDWRQGTCLHPSRSDGQNTMSQSHSSWRQHGNPHLDEVGGSVMGTGPIHHIVDFGAKLKMSKARNIFLHPEQIMKHANMMKHH